MAALRCPRVSAIAVVAGLACASAQAQRATPVVPPLAAGFNVSGDGCATGATSAMSALRPLPSRSPGGLLYERPPLPEPLPDAADWSIDGCAELGILVGDNDERSALFREYRDFSGDALLGVFSLTARAPGGARFVELGGGNVGRDDQYYGLRVGRYNAWSFAAYYDEIPHVLTDSFHSLWSGVGSAALTLANPALRPGGLASADATQAALRGVLAGTPDSTLQIQRKKGGLVLSGRPAESWRAFMSLSSERRQGARPLGAVFGGGDGGGNVEVPQSVDDTSQEISVGVSYADALTSMNVVLSAAQYRNQFGTMTFDNPLAITTSTIEGIAASAFTQGRFALDPDNDYSNARVDFARAFPDWFGARVTATASYGRLRQNESLLAPTTLPLAGASLNGIAADGLWNTAAALTRDRADASIDTRLLALTASVRPARSLSLIARYRDDRTDNDTDFQACNPQTGQLGRLLNDGSGAALVDVPEYLVARCDLAAIRALGTAPDAGDITLSSAPFEQSIRTYGLTADWRVSATASLAADAERKETERTWRERGETRDDRLKISYTERGLANAVVRASVEYAQRDGSAYDTGANDELISASLGPLPASGNVSTWFGAVDELRKFDLADRNRTTAQLRADFAAGEGLDIGLNLSGSTTRYPGSAVGRNGREDRYSIGVDANYVAADGLSLYGFYTLQSSRMQQTGAQPAGCLMGIGGVTAGNFQQCGALGGPLFPQDRTWQAESSDRNQIVGAGGRFEFGWGVVEFDYTYSSSRTSIDYAYGSGIFLSPERQALAGSGWPDLRFRQSVFAVGAWIPLRPRLSLRLRLQFESGEIDDWHYAGIAENPVPLANTVYLVSASREYHAAFGAILLRLDL